jgi:uroporphyrin-III C-methyltransferase
MNELFSNLPSLEKGTVWLAGAGPGDPGLLSLLTAKALTEADVIVHDALVNGEILKFAKGITAGIGGLAYAGIPVTHREVNHAVTFLTGHDSSGIVPDRIDWEALGRGSPVIVMYMAMKHIGQISANLIGAGRSPDEPVAFVCNAATSQQQVLETTLSAAERDVMASGLEPPAIVVIGQVVRYRKGMDWLGALSGRQLTTEGLMAELPKAAE